MHHISGTRHYQKALLKLGFEIAPFDPCLFVLRDPKTHEPQGVLGIHVDDGTVWRQ